MTNRSRSVPCALAVVRNDQFKRCPGVHRPGRSGAWTGVYALRAMNIRFVGWVPVIAMVLSLVPSFGQADPARNSIERNRAAMCAKADADGDSYRPFVCDARCDCLAGLVAAGEPIGLNHGWPSTSPVGVPARRRRTASDGG